MDVHSLERLDFPRICEMLSGYALTGLGRGLALTVHPIARPEVIRRWLRQFDELRRFSESSGLPPFGGITDVRDDVRRCAPPLRVNVETMARIGAALAGTHAVATYLARLPEDATELRHVAERVGDFKTVADRIHAVINERGEVRDDASSKLLRIRREIESVAGSISQAVEKLLRDPGLRRLLQYPNHTFHNDRMVVPLRTEYRGRVPGIIHRTSDSGATLYVEPAEVVELNNRVSNLRSEEDEEIARLLWELAHEIHLNGDAIIKTLDALAVIDLIVAKVRFADDYELIAPEVNDEARLSVRGARHPLLLRIARERVAAGEPPLAVVPIDYRLGEDFDLLIVTGPNTGGKTVALKTVGLVSLMVQAGLPAPVAPGSSVGWVQNVLIDVGDEQSMQQSLSTFSAHLTRIMDMLRRAGQRTLVLIDELGAGTDPDEGAAIGRAVLDELLRLQARCVVTTHLGALKAFALQRPRAENASVEFDLETLRPTYHLRIGESGSSNAIDIAQRLGLSRRLVAAARRNLSHRARVLHAALEGTAEVKRAAEQARDAAETARREAAEAQQRADQARAALQQQQSDFQTWVQRVVHLRPGDAVRVRNFERDGRIVWIRLDQQRAAVDVGVFTVETPFGDLLPPQTPVPPPRPVREPAAAPSPSMGKRARRRERGREPANGGIERGPNGNGPPRRERGNGGGPRRDRSERPGPIPSLSEAQIEALSPGDAVFAKRFHREGRVTRVQPAKRTVVLSVGMLEVEVPYSGLAAPQPAAEKPPRRPVPAPTPPVGAAPTSATPVKVVPKDKPGSMVVSKDQPGPTTSAGAKPAGAVSGGTVSAGAVSAGGTPKTPPPPPKPTGTSAAEIEAAIAQLDIEHARTADA